MEKIAEMIAAQGGDARVCELPNRLPVARQTRAIAATVSGYVRAIECEQIGYAEIALGGGRKFASDYTDEARAAQAERKVQQAYRIPAEPVLTRPKLVAQRIE